ncbi:platelet endothelial aggregation receptor 1-like [Ostrea edulis]|uniref:platelet endothelial aggregation receptor 1-like n=1 Tax=Ostrea edulis TaxID=37623 RepID=UPI0024AFB3FA|nr:platelet endothelial aggregation receptor 1-like [Ostrea edulis]
MFQVLSRSILYCLIGDYVCKSQICDGRCCDGYIFDPANATCKRCSPGYFGVNCSTQCPYPLYGHTCQSVCLCNMDACSPANGCLHVVTAEATTKPLSTEEEDKETTSHHSQATVTKRKVSTVVQSTTTRIQLHER